MNTLLPSLESFRKKLDFSVISDERKIILNELITYIQQQRNSGKEIHLNFICTHNSRRSQFSQIWAQTAAYYYGIKAHCYSGGVEVTAFNERAVESIKRTGFKVEKNGEGNPKYSLFFSDDAAPIIAFSKLYDDETSAKSNFAAVMTCSHADENCPFIPGADKRIPVRYNDPKAFDDTPLEVQKYDERSKEIATEMFYIFSQIL
ncbi:MAG: protein-tyrosine-phosphatase [Bacteroidetes bacterium]|nr:protein-tyrosine-phosphatase [Bacteroidota bacterium]